MQPDIDLDALRSFIDESTESMQDIEADFIALEQDPANSEIINRIFRPIHSLKGNSGFFGLTNINKFSHRLENVLDAARKGEISINREVIDLLLAGIDYLRKMLDRAATDPGDTKLSPDEEAFLSQIEEHATPAEKARGSIQSVLEFENLLNEFLDLGLEVEKDSLVRGVLDQLAAANQELRKRIEQAKAPAEKSAYSPDLLYFAGERDCTDTVRPLGRVFQALAESKPVSKEQLQEFFKALEEASVLLGDRPKTREALDELASMGNFLDDPLMAANQEFVSTVQQLINRVITSFAARHVSGDTQRLGEILIEQGLITEEQLSRALSKQKKIGELLVEEGVIAKEDLDKALNIQTKRMLDRHLKKETKPEAVKTIRIDQRTLDQFATSVGELFIALDSINYLKKMLEERADEELASRFELATTTLDERVEELHDNIMDIRRVPVKNLFQRFPRVVRQLAASLDKKVSFRMIGEETVIDKDVLEAIENPLVHLLRNALDHGLEPPEERKKKGKPAEGVLELAAASDENYVYITIRDDGRGIDPQRIKRTAVKKGFLSQEEADKLTDRELINLVFQPGFSSAEQVSDVSGRGVGMDAVLAGIKSCNGSIQLDSEVGSGTKVRLTIPLAKTLVTLEAMIVEAGGRRYVIPSEEITTVIEPDRTVSLMQEDECLVYNGSVLKVVDLHRFFYRDGAAPSRGERQMMVICRDRRIALAVDSLVSHQKVVAKEFTTRFQHLRRVRGIDGYTILGNDDVILIVDVKELSEIAGT